MAAHFFDRSKVSFCVRIGLLSVLLLLSGGPLVAQQLNDNCVVSILNRTVQVNSDGSWVLPNIPAGFGLVRARATCTQNGTTTFGQSDLFTIQPNLMNAIPQIQIGPTSPIPISIAIQSPLNTLNTAGQTVQLSTTATYANGTGSDITPSTAGTQYTVSNPAIATISPGGLVTALSSGTVLIQAVNEGRQGIISLQVILGASHGGIPDDWAIAHGLDPNDPAMPFEDPDHDGLTNLQEFQNGTDPHNPDTDGDGLTDGQEVLLYHTNPVLFSTDGTGISDGIEVQTGTLGGTLAQKLAAALQSLEVRPSSFLINVNTIQGQASQQLRVLGHLTDGKTVLDLTSTTEGTNYSSSDLTVCNFGVTDGDVFAGNNGPCTITVTNNGFSAQATGTVITFSPTALSFVSIPGYANGVAVNGNSAFVAAGGGGLQVVDVTDRTNPVIAGSLALPGNGDDVTLLGNFAYVAADTAGLKVIDVSNPLAPVLAGSLQTPGVAWSVKVRGSTAYVAAGTSGLQVIDVTNPTQPTLLGSLPLPGTSEGLDADLSRNLVVVVGDQGLFTVNVSNPTAPALLGSLNYGGSPQNVALNGNFAFVADNSSSLTSVDITNPATPVLGTSTDPNLGGELYEVALSNGFALGPAINFINTGVTITDISNPPSLISRAILSFTPGATNGFRTFDEGTAIAADGSYVYLTTNQTNGRLQGPRNGVAGDSRLYIGQYLAPVDNKGIPPTATITSPLNGATVVPGPIPITVNANDDVAVAAVNFLLNGQIVFTSTSAPYQFNATVPAGVSSLTIGATATDFGGNVGTAENVVVNVIPDPGTTVTGTVVDNNQNPVAGATVMTLGGLSATTSANGSFSIANVPTYSSTISARAVASLNGTTWQGSSSAPTVRGGITNVGVIALNPLPPLPPEGGVYQVFVAANSPAFLRTTSADPSLTITPNFDGVQVQDAGPYQIYFVAPAAQIGTLVLSHNGAPFATLTSDANNMFVYSSSISLGSGDTLTLASGTGAVTGGAGTAVFGLVRQSGTTLVGSANGTSVLDSSDDVGLVPSQNGYFTSSTAVPGGLLFLQNGWYAVTYDITWTDGPEGSGIGFYANSRYNEYVDLNDNPNSPPGDPAPSGRITFTIPVENPESTIGACGQEGLCPLELSLRIFSFILAQGGTFNATLSVAKIQGAPQ